MKLLMEIQESDVFDGGKDYFNASYKVRKAARGVIFNKERKIAVLYVAKHNYYKLPGGGFEQGESAELAFKREMREETGTEATMETPIGVIIEYRNKQKRLQISYCYYGRVTDESGEPQFTKKELDKGFKLKWVPLDEAINLMRFQHPTDYSGLFITIRDKVFLERLKIMMQNKS
ncbi:MAG: NUDIX domain-containing protein [Nanoarchaeota archaeon]|nr:NUDIX domain-containing protein [Nanoarchaeota archaeon]